MAAANLPGAHGRRRIQVGCGTAASARVGQVASPSHGSTPQAGASAFVVDTQDRVLWKRGDAYGSHQLLLRRDAPSGPTILPWSTFRSD